MAANPFNELNTLMKFFTRLILGGLFSFNLHAIELPADYQKQLEAEGFSAKQLNTWFSQVDIQQSILEAMERPAEKKNWAQYRPIFLTETRIAKGVEFWKTHQATLQRAEQTYGVPAEIIVAIIGVETQYGKNMGRYRVIDALSTLAFAYPRRASYFQKELTQFLLLCREEKLDPLALKGSYAGAMGFGQFMPTSYRKISVDFDGDGKKELITNTVDAIGSVAHYFNEHRWQSDAWVTLPVQVKPGHEQFLTSGLKPDQSLKTLRPYLTTPVSLPDATPARLFRFEGAEGNEYWLGLNNFYVITRYNTSPLYAMAVYQLSQQLASRFKATTTP